MEQAALHKAALMIPATVRLPEESGVRRPRTWPTTCWRAKSSIAREGPTKRSHVSARRSLATTPCNTASRPNGSCPPRHVLGATLLDAGRYAEAEAVYREDLAVYPPRHGKRLVALRPVPRLRMQKKTAQAAAVAARLKKAWQYADIKLTGSCLCLPAKN